MKTKSFTIRNMKELIRDPLSYIFILGFPIVMLIIMTIVDQSIPVQANMTVFHIPSLTPGIASFGLTFVMLFTCLQISKDRNSALLLRLYCSPMKASDFLIGYTLPLLIISVIQAVISYICGSIIGIFTGYSFQILYVVTGIIFLLPSALLFIAFGLFFGTLMNEKASPGVCSILITISCMLGGIWMDVDSLGGFLKKAACVLPFYHGVRSARLASAGTFNSDFWISLAIISGYAIVFFVLAVLLFRHKMKSDMK